ncbi:hypothetical protein SAMN00808754_1389 [Thermanaeromonas toyohensis ToBE]|uniref:Uncharacterized protein n=1 Tax=Thermanaeromonas toyohensis ToBE TaxID=698762 RepID=A0A1W1VRT3_9FIRM|nr:hypothetical protein [Thermanaeromonas toyohensis]SMB96046.1 hypothetical protein SAMN00808754_1389 [Thermanaeromonas toyohensis ToBE]
MNDLIDCCPVSCDLIKAIFTEVDACCRSCPEHLEGDCPEYCLAYRLLRLVPADFDFGVVEKNEP